MGEYFGIGQAVAAPIDAVANGINAYKATEQAPQMAQIQNNIEDSKSDSLYKSGWRPGFGWSLLFWSDLFMASQYYFAWYNWHIGLTQEIDLPIDIILFMTVNILGFSGLRSLDKWFGKK